MSTDTPFVIERLLEAPVEKVWHALTNKDKMKEWYFDIKAFEPTVGFEFEFDAGDGKKTYKHLCRITEVIAGKKLVYTWRYHGYEGDSLVTFELIAEGDKTLLKLTHEGSETFPSSDPSFAKESFAKGWTHIIGTSIKEFVEMGYIKKSIEINAPVSKVWSVLTHTETVDQWAAAFGEGVHAISDWQQGSEVIWKDKEGNIGAKGVVQDNDNVSTLKIGYYDNVSDIPPAPLGEYMEIYTIVENKGNSVLNIEAGPLALKYVQQHTPLWDKAVEKIKEYTERT